MQSLKKNLKHYRLSEKEYEKIVTCLGRAPKGVEWAIFSALWSEHCSYKSSKVHLKKFYSKNERVKESFGENAGVIDLGDEESVAFKMESHNHPSFISPHQGAATGVGGILRDIFTMGARPIALGNYLCFGEATEKHMPHIVDGVVRGIADYGNCVGVPMVTGQTEFHKSYNQNVLVNAFALGYFGPEQKVCTSGAHGVGNLVVYVGAKTGRDGVHGASMASESFDDDSESKKPTIQIGDPFYEKLLIESCLEVMKHNLVEAIQDMGAAGLTSSAFEMSAKGQVGVSMHLDKVPLRDSSLTPEEILLSESQERMLLICRPENLDQLKKIFHHWSLDAEVVGEVLPTPNVDLYWDNKIICSLDPSAIVDSAPIYNRAYEPWEFKNKVTDLTKLHVEDPENTFKNILKSLMGAEKSWIYNQYDQRVGAATARDCSESVGVVVLPSKRALGIVLGCRPYLMRMDASIGGMDAVFHPSLQLALKGFTALAVTDCLNFGNPEKSNIMSEFVASVEGMSEACEAIDAPVISGNVSFYNETKTTNITSTPSTGVVGLKSSLNNIPTDQFKSSGELIYLLKLDQVKTLGAACEVLNRAPQFKGELDVKVINEWLGFIRKTVQEVPISSSKAVGKFGLAYSIFRMTSEGIGAQIKLPVGFEANDLFNETLYQAIVTISPSEKQSLETMLNNINLKNFTYHFVGETGGDDFKIEGLIDLKLKDLKNKYSNSWGKNFETLA